MTFRPGARFFEDYDRFYRRKAQGERQHEFHIDRQEISEPLKVAYLFTEKRTGHPATSIAFVPSKDVQTAKQLLATIAFSEIAGFLDYALIEASKTNFDIQTLGGTKQYIAGYLAFLQRQTAAKDREAARMAKERQEATQHAYERFRRAQAADIYARLPEAEQAIIEAKARAHAASFRGSLRDSMFEFGKARFTIERHADKLTTFDQWEVARQAA